MNSIKLFMDKTNLREVECIKYLGVILDNKLSWVQHISYVKNKISEGIGIMHKARNYIHKKSLLGLYHSYIYILTLFIALNLGATHQIVTLILYLLYKSAFLESSHFPAMMFHQNHISNILIFCLYISWFIIESGL